MALPNFSSIAKSVTSFAQGTSMPKSGSTVFDILDPAKQRRMISGLPFGGGSGVLSKLIPNFGFFRKLINLLPLLPLKPRK